MTKDMEVPRRYCPQRVEILVHPDGLFYVYIINKSDIPLMRDDTGEAFFQNVRKKAIYLGEALGVPSFFNEHGAESFFPLGFSDEPVVPYYTRQAVKREQAKWPRKKERTKR